MPALILQMMLLALLMALLLRMAIGDLRAFIIPNRLNLAIAVLGVAYVLSAYPLADVPAQLGWRMVQALCAGGLFAVLFVFGWMGGGDVKLIAALALWFALPELAQLLIYTSLAGGALAVLSVVLRRRQAAATIPDAPVQPVEIPYGIAIACGAMIPAGQLFVKATVTLLAA